MITSADVDALIGLQVVDRDGARLGAVVQFSFSEDGAQPLFVTVHAGRSGTTESFVPLQSAELRDGVLHVAYDRRTIAAAPVLAVDRPITDDEQGTIFDYYDGAAGGEPSGVDGTPAGLSDTPEERTVLVPGQGTEQGSEPPTGRADRRDADPLGGEAAPDPDHS